MAYTCPPKRQEQFCYRMNFKQETFQKDIRSYLKRFKSPMKTDLESVFNRVKFKFDSNKDEDIELSITCSVLFFKGCKVVLPKKSVLKFDGTRTVPGCSMRVCDEDEFHYKKVERWTNPINVFMDDLTEIYGDKQRRGSPVPDEIIFLPKIESMFMRYYKDLQKFDDNVPPNRNILQIYLEDFKRMQYQSNWYKVLKMESAKTSNNNWIAKAFNKHVV